MAWRVTRHEAMSSIMGGYSSRGGRGMYTVLQRLQQIAE
jgi:hypothetical protein